MTQKEFKKYIKSIGFKLYDYNDYGFRYEYKEFRIDLYNDGDYDFFSASNGVYNISHSDLKPIYDHFKQELRSIKLKKILK